MAMEDAVALAACLSAARETPERALIAYRDRRLTRTARVQLQSRQVGEHIYHPDGAHAKLRNEIMRAKTQEQWLDTLAWLYGGHG